MTVKERIQEYLDSKGIKTFQLEKQCGFSSGYWRKTVSVSAEACATILGIYTDLSAEWVLRGTGSMLRTESAKPDVFDLLADEIRKRL